MSFDYVFLRIFFASAIFLKLYRKWVNPDSCGVGQEPVYDSDDDMSIKSGFSVQSSKVNNILKNL